jgi:hypothetical protein
MAKLVRRARRWQRLGIASVALALGLSSCALFTEDSAPPIVQAPAPPPVAALPRPAPPRPTRKPTPPPVPPPGDQSPATSEQVDPERLIGLDESDAANWLGEPNQRTDAPPATIWRYLSKDCQIDVYFYLDLQRGVMRALHYEVRSEDIVERRPERCFQQLVGERRQRDNASAAYRPR